MPDIEKRSEVAARGREHAAADSQSQSRQAQLRTFYCWAEFFVVRTPLYPVQRLLTWAGDNSLATVSPAARTAYWESRRASLTAYLGAAFADPTLRLATFFGSPELELLVPASVQSSQQSAKLGRTLTRYFMRCAARETPFGLFAGVSLGQAAAQDRFELSGEQSYRRSTSLSPSYLGQILGGLAARPDVRDGAPHELNSTVSLVHGNYRFASNESVASRTTAADNAAMELLWTPQLEQVVARAATPTTPEALAQRLRKGKLTAEATLEFARTLCERRFLEPAWLPAATGEAPLTAAIEALRGYPSLAEVAELLRATKEELAHADANGIEQGSEGYREIAQRLRSLAEPPTGRQALQAELSKPSPHLAMSPGTATRFLQAAALVQRTASAPSDPDLTEFRARFVRRYEARWVPLAEALDGDLGIGFGPAMVYAADTLLQDVPQRQTGSSSYIVEPADRIRLRIVQDCLASGHQVYELDQATLDLFPNVPFEPHQDFPESLAVVARLARNEQGELLVVAPTVVCPSVLPLLARFCHANPNLEDSVKREAAFEQALAGDAVLADVAYFPQDNAANIVVRPVLREYEIPYFGRSGAPRVQQLPITDLLVTVRGERVIMCSARLNKQIKVRIANALNYSSDAHLPVYRFFGSLQAQDSALASGWSWGMLADADFLPRVIHGHTILSLAKWKISGSQLAGLLEAEAAEAFFLVQDLRKRLRLPRWLTRPEGDRKMPLDLDNELSVEELLHEARHRSFLVLEELVPSPDGLVMRGPEGTFSAEFVVPFRRVQPQTSVPPALPSLEQTGPERRHGLGSDWLYAKIYVARSEWRAVLRRVRAEVAEPMLGSVAHLWFFLPYADPDSHLRIRFNGSSGKLRTQLLPRLQRTLEPFLQRGAAWRVQLDTYEQEIERYGGPLGMELSEKIFWADSEASCQLLDLCTDDDEFRWQVTFLGIDRLLADFGLSIERRIALATRASEEYGTEVDANASTWKAIGAKYRRYTPRLTELRDRCPAPVQAVFERRSAHIVPLWRRIEEGLQEGTVRTSSEQLVRSFCHLHAVRMLGIQARSYELVLFDFLRRSYASRSAQEARKNVLVCPS